MTPPASSPANRWVAAPYIFGNAPRTYGAPAVGVVSAQGNQPRVIQFAMKLSV